MQVAAKLCNVSKGGPKTVYMSQMNDSFQEALFSFADLRNKGF